MNFTDAETPYTKIVEHKHFEFGKGNPGDEPYYPVNDERNQTLYEKYKAMADKETNVIFGGRLAEYKYYDMDKVIKSALDLCNQI